jgi:hypothetical protein
MAFDRNGLSLMGDRATIGTGKGSTKRTWSYFTNDALTVVEANGYFDALAENGFNHGDIVMVSADLDGTPAGQLYVAVVTSGDVALTAFTDATGA